VHWLLAFGAAREALQKFSYPDQAHQGLAPGCSNQRNRAIRSFADGRSGTPQVSAPTGAKLVEAERPHAVDLGPIASHRMIGERTMASPQAALRPVIGACPFAAFPATRDRPCPPPFLLDTSFSRAWCAPPVKEAATEWGCIRSAFMITSDGCAWRRWSISTTPPCFDSLLLGSPLLESLTLLLCRVHRPRKAVGAGSARCFGIAPPAPELRGRFLCRLVQPSHDRLVLFGPEWPKAFLLVIRRA